MSQLFSDLKVGLDDSLEEKLRRLVPDYLSHRVTRKSVDARRSRSPHFVYSVEVFSQGEVPSEAQFELTKVQTNERPIIVGTGPAGLFAALRLAERGIASTVLERGSEATARMKSINRHWRYGELNPEDNVCFGEGGAGLYSDGKLITRIKSPHIPYVMNRLVQFGAPKEIEYLANPHVGSDRIRRVIPKIRQFLIDKGCDIHFNTKVSDLIVTPDGHVTGVQTENNQEFLSPFVILATGHSAQNVFDFLEKHKVQMTGKSFAMGLRIEHPQKLINQLQYREAAEHPKLGAANYKLTHHDKEKGLGVYSFCMCPGGYVISSGTEATGVVSNGMSNYHRNSPFANAAIVVTVDFEKNFGSSSLFEGLRFRSELERKALKAVLQAGGQKQLPAQTVEDFLKGKKGEVLKSSSPSGAAPVNFNEILPQSLTEPLKNSLSFFEKRMPGFSGKEAMLHGVESRTSCPIRVDRDKETHESLSHKGLYPTGEGAGYAGGITSAAVDGIRIAESIASLLSSQTLQIQQS